MLNTNNQSSIISFGLNNEFDKNTNILKSRCFHFLTKLIRYNKGKLNPDEDISKVCINVVVECVKTLEFLVKDKLIHIQNLDEPEFLDNGYTSFICYMMDFLGTFLTLDFVIPQFKDNIQTFCINILFPFLISGAKEKALMKKDGKDFHNVVIDITTERKVFTIKTKAAKLLKIFSDKYSRLGEFLINFYLQLLDYIVLTGISHSDALQSNNLNLVNIENYQLLQQYSPYQPLINISHDKILESLLLLFNIVIQHVLVPNTEKLFKTVFQKHMPNLLIIQDDMIREKLCLLLGNFIDNIYDCTTDYESFKTSVQFLFNCLFQFNSNQGLSYQAANSIKDLIYVNSYAQIFNDVLKLYFSDISLSIKENENLIFFDVILEIVVYINNPDYTIEICKEVTNRVLREIKTPNRNKDDKTNNQNTQIIEYNEYINKCFNVLKGITQNEEMCNMFSVILNNLCLG